MSKKNLLNEAQIRQFMKLAKLEPLTPGFVNGLTEKAAFDKGQQTEVGGKADESPTKGQDKKGGGKAYEDLEEGTEEELDELRTGRTGALGPKDGTANPGHGRGQGEAANGSLFEEEDVDELEGDIAHDLGDDSLEGDEEAAGDELEIDAELAPEGGDGRMVSVEDFLSALESALETFLGDEVEVDATEMDDEEDAVEDEFAPDGDEVVADVEVEDELELEEGAFTLPGRRKKKWDRIAKGLDPSSDPEPHGEEEEESAKKWKAQHGSDPKAGTRPTTAQKMGIDPFASATRKRTAGSRSPYSEGQSKGDMDAVVEQVTKRVAARILKSALNKK